MWICRFFKACRYGHVQHLEHLLFYGADMSAQNASGNTALHVCALYNQVPHISASKKTIRKLFFSPWDFSQTWCVYTCMCALWHSCFTCYVSVYSSFFFCVLVLQELQDEPLCCSIEAAGASSEPDSRALTRPCYKHTGVCVQTCVCSGARLSGSGKQRCLLLGHYLPCICRLLW